MRSANPTLNERTFQSLIQRPGEEVMTMRGTVSCCLILLSLVFAAAGITWYAFGHTLGGFFLPAAMGGGIAGFVLAMVIIFKQTWAPFLAPVYALVQGVFMGAISAYFEYQYSGIVLQAVGLTFATAFTMLFVYQSGLIRVTDTFRMVVMSATGGILLVYLASFALSFFGITVPFIHDATPLGIGISFFIVGIAALNLVLDFDLIDKGIEAQSPKYMEWYGAFALTVTLVWLYLEILRLLSKLRRR